MSATPAKALLDLPGGPGDCSLGPPSADVDLLEAFEYALCNNPRTRQAWIDVKAKAAQLGVARSEYLPSVNAALKYSRDRPVSDVPSQPVLSSRQRSSFHDYAIDLSWKLLDMGGRKADNDYASETLAAALAVQDDTLQAVLALTAKDFYAAEAAQSALAAARGTEEDAARSLQAAKARYAGGVAAIVDQMQAQTEYARAVFDRAKAAGEAKSLRGVLAADMGLSPDVSLSLPALPEDMQADVGADIPIGQLMEEARRSHPRTIQAQALLRAARAKVEVAKAQGRPSLSLNMRADTNSQPVVPAVGVAPLPATGRDRFIGLQIDIPLFDGFARSYEVQAAQAAVESQQESLRDAEQQVMLNVWSSYIALETDVEKLKSTQAILESARLTYVAAQQRYQKGVGSILELLTAQTALGSARQQRVSSLAEWRSARLQLAASVGRLSLTTLR